MGTSAALACFAFVLLAMNFATYFAEMTPDEDMKPTCDNKAYRETVSVCFKEKGSALAKELYSVCAKNVGIKGDFSFKLLFDVSCVKGGGKIYIQVSNCIAKVLTERDISIEKWEKEMQPTLECWNQKRSSKRK